MLINGYILCLTTEIIMYVCLYLRNYVLCDQSVTEITLLNFFLYLYKLWGSRGLMDGALEL